MQNLLSLTPAEFHQLASEDPSITRQLFCQIQDSPSVLPDDLINALLGLEITPTERSVNHFELTRKFGIEQYTYEATSYEYIRWIVRVLEPSEKDVFYDLGAGYGQVVLYTALTTRALCKGIELVPERIQQATAIKQRYAITNAEFIAGNILAQDYSDGTIFFLFNPFHEHTFQQVLKKLQTIAQHHHIKIAGWGGGRIEHLSQQPWLYQYGQSQGLLPTFPYPVTIFASN